ncbi:MAG TPA: serpin family protein, partial [Candidatus Edwardsbacteria bacterium]|nr:serpin family protein [Candidatus Edwardsbacteria bacterium]
GIAAFLKQLTAARWARWTAAMERRSGDLALPRFTIEYQDELSRPLAKLGMARAFGDRADFSGISRAGLAISEVRHKTFLTVDEEGTEAAAVTSVGLRTTAVVIEPPPFAMTVDHPFVLAITDQATGAILFLGVIADPD